MKGQINIDSIHAFVMRDTDGTEGVAGMMMPGGGLMPLIAADAERVASLEKIAQQLADTTGKTISLVQFTHRVEIRTIEPNRAYDRGKAVRLGESEVGIPHPPGWEKAFGLGAGAFGRDTPLDSNPYESADPLREYWELGWLSAKNPPQR